MSIKIIGDSTMDLSQKVQDELDIHCVPFSIEFGGDVKKDGSFPNEEMYQYNLTHKDICRSSAVNVGEALNFFENEEKMELSCFISPSPPNYLPVFKMRLLRQENART